MNPSTPTYRWGASQESPVLADFQLEGQASKLRWWSLLAVVLSIFLHVLLFFVFNLIRVSRDAAPIRDIVLARPMQVDRISIDPALLDDLVEIPEGNPSRTPDPAETGDTAVPKPSVDSFVDQSLDVLDVENSLSQQDIVATPLVDEVENLAPPAPAPGAEASRSADAALEDVVARMEARTTEDLTSELDSVREQLIRTPRVSEGQMLLELGAAGDTLDDPGEELLTELAAQATGSEGEGAGGGVPDGYADLDSLLRYDGPIVDLTKPIMMPTDLLFDYNESILRESAKLSLMKLGFLVQKNPEATFIIEGHTDSFGGEAYNLDLSRRRADAVRDWLVDTLKLTSDRLVTRGIGKGRPIADPSGTVEEQALNRRVEIVVRQPRAGEDGAR